MPVNQIVEYIKNNYDPVSIIVYGSYSDGTNNLSSDFDALVISGSHRQVHDTSFVGGIQLDVFVYPASYFEADYDCADFIQIVNGIVLFDTEGKGKLLKDRVVSFFQSKQGKTDEEIKANIDWCAKMLSRTKRNDTEGMYRWHWVLIDSLEIFCDAAHHTYLGPKKALLWMEANHPAAYSLYQKALFEFTQESLSNWIEYLEKLI